jgi:hypothetical protein
MLSHPRLVAPALALMASIAFAPAAHAQLERDLVVVLDGSTRMGSYCLMGPSSLAPDAPYQLYCADDAYWDAQIEGVQRLVRSFVELQGKVAITVVQSTGGQETFDPATGTRTHSGPEVVVPRTVLYDEADIAAVQTALANAQQVVGNPCPRLDSQTCASHYTTPAWGIHAATEHLLLAAEASVPLAPSVEYCLTGDLWFQSPPSWTWLGWDAESRSRAAAWAEAKHKVGMNRFAMVGVYTDTKLDPFESHEANALLQEQLVGDAWSWMLRGGGNISYSASPAAFARALPNGCFVDDVELLGVEVTQGLQNLNHDMPLLAQRPTVVRAHLRALETKLAITDIVLHGWNEYGYLGELEGLFTPARIPDVYPLAPNARQIPSQSQIFQLPGYWTDSTFLEVEVEQVGADMVCNEQLMGIDDSRDCRLRLDMRTDLPSVKTRIFDIVDPVRAQDSRVPAEIHGRALDRVLQQLPLNGITLQGFESIDAPSSAIDSADDAERWAYVTDLVYELDRRRYMECSRIGACDVFHYGLFQMPTAVGPPVGSMALPMVAVEEARAFDNLEEHGAHEWGHGFDLQHAAVALCDPSPSGTDGPALYDPWPWLHSVAGKTGPAITENETPYAAAWGFDLELLKRGLQGPRAVRNPALHFEIMSYCSPAAWISTLTYQHLVDHVPLRLSVPPPLASGAGAPREIYLVVSGNIDETGAVEFAPAMQAPLPMGSEDTEGAWTARGLNSGGTVLETVSFRPGEPTAGLGNPTSTRRTFAAALPYDSNIRQLEIEAPDGQTTLVVGSGSRPLGLWQSPAPGATLSGVETLMWDAFDSDGDPLTFMVEYSADGGETWQALHTSLTDTLFDVDTRLLPASSEAYFRLATSDGVRTYSAEVGPLTVVNAGPQVLLLAPDTATYHGGQSLALRALAFDADDGALPSSSFVWSSDIDGDLGFGADPGLLANALSVGTHNITVMVTDADGASSTANTEVVITSQIDAASLLAGPDLRPLLDVPAEVREPLTNIVQVSLENVGTEDAAGTVVLSLALDTGLNVVAVDQGTSFNCVTVDDEVTCTLLDGPLPAGAESGVVLVEVDPDPAAAAGGSFVGSLLATATGDVDTVPFNDELQATVLVRTASFVDLALQTERQGAWVEGYSAAVELIVDNVGEADVGDAIVVTYDVPAGATVLTAGGDGWQCDLLPTGVSCSWMGAPLQAGASLPPIVLEVDVGSATGASAANVSTPLDADATNDSTDEQLDIVRLVSGAGDLALYASIPEGSDRGVRASVFVELQNLGPRPLVGPHEVEVLLPPEVTFAFATGDGWSCTEAAGVVTCGHPAIHIDTQGYAPGLWVYADVAQDLAGSVAIDVVRTLPVDDRPENDTRTLEASGLQSLARDQVITMTPSALVVPSQGFVDLDVQVASVSAAGSTPNVRFELAGVGERHAWFDVLDDGGWACERYVDAALRCEQSEAIVGVSAAPLLQVRVWPGPFAEALSLRARMLSGQASYEVADAALLHLPVDGGAWSPGALATVSGNQAESTEVTLQSTPTGGRHPLTEDGREAEADVAFSSDGRRMVFARDASCCSGAKIWVQDLDGSEAQVLSVSPDNAQDSDPWFTADGAWVVFQRRVGSERSIVRVRPDGSELSALIEGLYITHFALGADDAIYFEGSGEVGGVVQSGLFRADPDGGNITHLTDFFQAVTDLSVSPDGAELAVTGQENVDVRGVFLLSTDPSSSSLPVRVFDDELPTDHVRHSPDGAWIVWSVSGTSKFAVLYRRADGAIFRGPSGRDATFAPLAVDGLVGATPLTLMTELGQPVTLDVDQVLSEPDGEPLRVLDVQRVVGGRVACSTASVCRFQPRGQFAGYGHFEIVVQDTQAHHQVVPVTVVVEPPPPVLALVTPSEGDGVAVPPGEVNVEATLQLDVATEAVDGILVVDTRTGAALSNENVDCDGDGLLGQPGDDVNGNGVVEGLDCFIAAAEKIVDDLAAQEGLRLGVMLIGVNAAHGDQDDDYEANIRFADMRPAAGSQRFTSVRADEDNNGVADVIDVMRSIEISGDDCNNSHGAYRFEDTAPFVCRTGLNPTWIDDALVALSQTFETQSGAARRAVYWLSLDAENVSTDEGAPLWSFLGSPLHLQALAPSAFGCDPGTPLTLLAERTQGNCSTLLNDPLAFVSQVGALTLPDIEVASVQRESDAPLAAARPAADRLSATVTGIVPGPNVLTARVETAFGAVVQDQVTVFGQDGLFNTPPQPVDDIVTGASADPIAFNVLDNDADPDSDALALVATAALTEGSVSCAADGNCLYTPVAVPSWPVTFTYDVRDGRGGRAPRPSP